MFSSGYQCSAKTNRYLEICRSRHLCKFFNQRRQCYVYVLSLSASSSKVKCSILQFSPPAYRNMPTKKLDTTKPSIILAPADVLSNRIGTAALLVSDGAGELLVEDAAVVADAASASEDVRVDVLSDEWLEEEWVAETTVVDVRCFVMSVVMVDRVEFALVEGPSIPWKANLKDEGPSGMLLECRRLFGDLSLAILCVARVGEG
jgi:hypothetical protein